MDINEHINLDSINHALNVAVHSGLDPDAWLLVNSEIAIALEKRGEIKRIQYADPAAEIAELRAERDKWNWPWHSDRPKKEGLYLVELELTTIPKHWYETAFWDTRSGWSLPKESKDGKVTWWMEIPPRS